MLVLSRERNESIMIGDDIEIIIADVRGNKVRLGITAPREVSIHRKEVYMAIQEGKPRPQARTDDKSGVPHKVDKSDEGIDWAAVDKTDMLRGIR